MAPILGRGRRAAPARRPTTPRRSRSRTGSPMSGSSGCTRCAASPGRGTASKRAACRSRCRRTSSALPRNDSLEAVAVAPPGHPLAGALVAIAEQARPGENAPTKGWVLTGAAAIRLRARAATASTSRTSPSCPPARRCCWSGASPSCPASRAGSAHPARRFQARGPRRWRDAASRPTAATRSTTWKGIATHRDPARADGHDAVSDDNFSPFQRTLLLEFVLS